MEVQSTRTSNSSGPTAGRDAAGTITFYVPQDAKPYFKSSALTGGEPEVFFETETRRVVLQDMRPRAGELSLDREGFQLLHRPTAVDDLYDDTRMESEYDAEIEALLKDTLGAQRVAVFDRTRRSDAPEGAANPDGFRGPADRIHVDYTVASGPQRAVDVLGQAEVDRILGSGGRIVQVNVWRPISGPVRRSPLALADARSIRPEHLAATDQIFPDRIGEIYMVAHAEGQQWYWAPEMGREEVLLIKGWDSLDDGRARFTPHAACRLENQDPKAPARESIEVRTLVIFEGPPE